jgi:hypothetical protein
MKHMAFIRVIQVDGKDYDLHLEFIGGFYNKGKPSNMGTLRQELCCHAGDGNYITSETIQAHKNMTEGKAKAIITVASRGTGSVEDIFEKAGNAQYALDYLSAQRFNL